MRKLPKPAPPASFDYNALDEATRVMVLGHTGVIRQRLTNLTRHTVEVGRMLVEVKDILDHGDFGTWLDFEFQMTTRTARRFMAAYRISDIVSDLGARLEDFTPTALYLLGAPSMRNDVIDRVVGLALDGAKVTPKLIKQVERELRPEVVYLPSPTGFHRPPLSDAERASSLRYRLSTEIWDMSDADVLAKFAQVELG